MQKDNAMASSNKNIIFQITVCDSNNGKATKIELKFKDDPATYFIETNSRYRKKDDTHEIKLIVTSSDFTQPSDNKIISILVTVAKAFNENTIDCGTLDIDQIRCSVAYELQIRNYKKHYKHPSFLANNY